MADMSDRIKDFFKINSGSGYGSGYGSGSGGGSGYGSGYGSGDGGGSGSGSGYGSGGGSGSGSGYGDGSGYGHRDGDGDDLITFNGNKVYYIDEVPTVIEQVHLNLAKGYIINKDLTTEPCFIAKGDNMFAHGSTSDEAIKALQDKIFENMDTDEKIEMFISEFKPDVKYTAKSFYDWHHMLTGSCEFGRNAFVKNHGIDIEHGMYTVKEFIEITINDFGGEIIKQLGERWSEYGT